MEDEPATRQLLTMALSDDAFTVVTAATHDVALGECLTVDPAVILLDLHLGRGQPDGTSFLREYRARGGRAKVLVVSGLDQAEELTRGLDIDGLIGKPFDVDALVQTVQREVAPA